MELLILIGKIIFSLLFILSGIDHFKYTSSMGKYARSKGVKYSELVVYLSGVFLIIVPILFIVGFAESVMLGLLAIFLTLTAFIFHAYWKEADPTLRSNERIAFNKELSLIGAIIIILSLL